MTMSAVVSHPIAQEAGTDSDSYLLHLILPNNIGHIDIFLSEMWRISSLAIFPVSKQSYRGDPWNILDYSPHAYFHRNDK